MRYTALAAIAAAVFVAPAWGQASNRLDLRYMYLQADYVEDSEVDHPTGKEDGDGWGAKARIAASAHAFVALEYHSVDNSNGRLYSAAAGLGLRTALLEWLDLYGTANYERFNLAIPGVIDDDADGYSGALGLRLFLGERLELSAEGRLADFGDKRIGGSQTDIDSAFYSLGAVFRFTDALALSAEYLTGEYEFEGGVDADVDRDDVRLGLRWYLDP